MLGDIQARMEIEALADAFRARLEVGGPPVDVKALAGLCGIIDISYDEISGSALLITGPLEGTYAVVLRRREPSFRQRFSIAHEIAHRVLHPDRTWHNYRAPVAARGRRDPVERSCDYFAACLLMPRRWVLEHATKASSAAELARAFDVSTPAMRSRLRELGENRLAYP